MPRAAWSAKRERQYEHIKDSLLERGESESTAEEIAARTVNKERAQQGEARTANPQTLKASRLLCAAAKIRTAARRAARASSCTKTPGARTSGAGPG